MTQKSTSTAISVGIASLFLISMGVPYIVPLLAQLGGYFPDVNPASISYAMSIAFLGNVFGPLICGALASRKIVGYKTLAIIATIIYLVCSVMPVAVHSWTVLLVTRFLVGFSSGCMNVIANPLVTAFFEGNARAKVLSLGTAMAYVGTLCMQFLVGLLGDVSFWLAFLAPGLSILSVIGAIFLIKEPLPEDLPDVQSERGALPGKVWYCAIVLCIAAIAYMPIAFNYSFYVQEISDSLTLSATIQVIATGGSIVGGLCYAFVLKGLKRFTLAFACLLMVIGPIIFITSHNLPLMIIGQFLVGFGYCTLLPCILQCIGVSTKPTMVAFATAIAMALMNLASFLGTPFIQTVGAIAGDPIGAPIWAGSVIFAVLMIITAIASPITKEMYAKKGEEA